MNLMASWRTHRVLEGSELLQEILSENALLEAIDVAAQGIELGAQRRHLTVTVSYNRQDGEPN